MQSENLKSSYSLKRLKLKSLGFFNFFFSLFLLGYKKKIM